MLISNIFSRKVYPITVIGLLVLELIFLAFICIFFYVSLNYNTDYLVNTMVENNREIEKSFNSFLIRRINSAKKDLFLIGKHSDIFKGNLNLTIKNNSKFYENLSSCLIDSSDINNSPFADKYNNISDKENPMISIVSDYLKNNIFNSESMIKDFVNNSLLNYVSYFGTQEDNINNYQKYICYMKLAFKSIFIKESISKGKYMSLSNIFLFMNNLTFQYLPQETNIKTLQKLSIYSKKVTCEYFYSSSCIFEFIKNHLIYSKNEENGNYVEYFHFFDAKYNLYSCLNLQDFSQEINNSTIQMKNNSVCIMHNLKYLLEAQFNFFNLTTMTIKNNMTDLISVQKYNEKLLLIYTLGNNVNEFFNIYNSYFINYNDNFKDYIFSETTMEIELFHLIYFSIFKYKQDEITNTLIEELISEYESIKKEIIKGMDDIELSVKSGKNNTRFEKLVKCSQHYLYTSHNITGLIDNENGKIKKGSFIYLITPLIDRNIYYEKYKYTKINISSFFSNKYDNEANILGFNIILYQDTFDIWNYNLFILMILIIIKWSIFFLIIIVFLTTLINVIFTKVLDKIFNPISLLYNRLSTKMMSSKLFFSKKDINNKSNNSFENNNDKENLISEIVPLTPEMEELIQLVKFLENISYMKELMLSNEQMELDFDLMNEMYNILTNRIDMIKYGHFVSSFYFKKKKYVECNNSIKIIENILESEEDKFKEENENIEIEVINVISNKYYINEFQSSKEVFENKTSLSQLNFYELIIIREKLYFYLGICNLFQIVELKKKVKDLKKDYEMQNKKNYYNNLRGRALSNRKFQSKSNSNSKGFDNTFGRESVSMKLNSQIKAIEILEGQIIKMTDIAIKYFKLSYEINNKYCINKIKCIIILLYIAKCQLYKEKNKSEAIDTMKNAIIKLYTLNQDFIKMNEICQFNPIIMLLINGAIMEQILYLIAKINNKTNNKLTVELLSDIMKLSYFKTDDIQSKTAKNITYLIKKASSNLKSMNKKINNLKKLTNKISFFEKMAFRLNSDIIFLQNNNPNIIKNIFILFSPNLIKVLPSSIELSEILSKCVRNYMNPHDRIQCLRFDMNYNCDNFKNPFELNKDFITRILQGNDLIKNDKYGMQNCVFSIVNNFNKINFKKIENDFIDKDIINNDNYIFQFILSKDYTFDSPNNSKKFKDELKNSNISLYTFVFDDELKSNNSKENNKMNDVIKNMKKIPEGVLIFVDNFLNIKMVFQNISRKYKPKNIFRINSKSYDNIYFDYH